MILLLAAACSSNINTETLVGQTWQWVHFTDPMQSFDVPNPDKYALSFQKDGTVNIVADCNNASGTYTVDDSNLTIELGPMTMVACPPDSLSDDYLKNLSFVRIYFFQDGHLFLDMMADGGTLEFAPAP
jgi:heat shock protein HslJ